MDKNELKKLKRLLSLSLIGTMGTQVGCSTNKIPTAKPIDPKYSKVEEYYKYTIKNGEAVKMYKSENVYLLYNKESYEVKEYIYDGEYDIELYDLKSEEMIAYSNPISSTYNKEYYYYIRDNNYQVCLNDVENYVEGRTNKEYYSLEEIKELEPKILEGLKIINTAKQKIK